MDSLDSLCDAIGDLNYEQVQNTVGKFWRERLALSVSQGKGNKDALRVVDYALAHPSSLEQAREQIARSKRKSEETEKKNS